MAEAPADPALTPFDSGEQFSLLLDLMHEINQGASLERAFELVADALRQIFGIDRFALVLLQGDGLLDISASRGLSNQYLGQVRQHIAEGAGARALAQRRPMYIPDVTRSSAFHPFEHAAEEEGFRTVLILPLFSGSDPLGYLIMYHNQLRAYTPPEIVLAQALSQQVALAVQNGRLLQAAEEHRKELESQFQRRVAEAEAIDDIVLRISSSLDPAETLQSIADAAAALSGADSSSIYLLEADGQYRAMAAHGVPLERLRGVVLSPDVGLIGQIRRICGPVQVVDYAGEVENASGSAEVERTGTRAAIGVPLVRNGEVVGALYAGRKDPEHFPPDTVRTLQRLAEFAQVAVQNARRFSNLAAERSRLQAYLDAIPEAVVVVDRQGRVVMLNQTLQHQWRIRGPLADILGQDVRQLLQRYASRSVKFRYDPMVVFRRVLESGKSEQVLLEIGNPPRMFETHLSPLRGREGVTGVVATTRDISVPIELGRERTRSHLLSQLLELSAFLNSGLSIPGLSERVVEAAMALIGARSGAMGLREDDHLVFRRIRIGHEWVDIDVVTRPGQGISGHMWETEEPYVTNDYDSDPYAVLSLQDRYPLHKLVGVPMIDSSGRLVGTLEVHDPVVERDFGQMDVEALQLLAHQATIALENSRLNQLKDEFLSIVSHELKTPVTTIKGFTQVLQRRLSPESLERCGHYLDTLNHQADRLTGLINDLLDLSRIQQGRFTFEKSRFDYGRLVHDVVAEMQLVTTRNPIVLTGPDHVQAVGNPDRLRQVLVNLIDNAAKHGPPDSAIRITVEQKEHEVETFVCDDGNGLPLGEAERIFGPYYQVRQGGKQQAKGLGLGLYVSRQIVEEHGGRIWLDTTDHTSFCFTVPIPG